MSKQLARKKEKAPAKPKQIVQLSDEEKQEFKEAFDLFDTDKSNTIDYQELKVALKALGFQVKKPEVMAIMKEYDKEGNGLISYDDFIEVCVAKTAERDPMEEIHYAFTLFDEDNSGKISLKNMKKIAKELGETLSDDDLRAMIDEFDKDKDGMSIYIN